MKAKITISRPTSNRPPYTYISINIQDDSSGIHIINVQMSLEDFAHAITGLGNVDCEIHNLTNNIGFARIGKIREYKEVFVYEPDYKLTILEKQLLVEKAVRDSGYLVDGWEISDHGLHRQQPTQNHCVSLRRFVDGDKNEA
jgi:hypothetical protein